MPETKSKMSQQEQMVKGTAWSTAGNFVSRLLGALYIIPWYAWMGQHATEANALFNMGYNIYAYFLLISTTGLNVAIAKQVAKYNSMGQEERSYQLIRSTLKLMLVLGLVFAAIMFFGSPIFAGLSGGGSDLVPIMHSLSLAVLVFPAMSVIRGVFQGYNDLQPFALSQIAEQIVRVIWMLLTAFMIMKLGSGNYITAVTQSTFAAFIGMIASLIVLFYYLQKNNLLANILKKSDQNLNLDVKGLLLETLKESIPFIIIGSAIQAFQIIDQWTFVNTMSLFTNFSRRELWVMFGYFSANPSKITMILIAVAGSIGGVGIALLTENFVKKDMKAAAKLIIHNIEMLLVFLLPAVTGAVILAKPLYAVFYGIAEPLAVRLFIVVLIEALILGFYTLLAPMLQALFENRKAMLYFAYGLIVKIILQIPFINLFHAYGPLLSTAIAMGVPIYLMYKRLHQVTHFNRVPLRRTSLLILILTAIMALVVTLGYFLLGLILPVTNRYISVFYLVILGSLGIGIYGYLALLTRLLDKFIGQKAAQLRLRFKVR